MKLTIPLSLFLLGGIGAWSGASAPVPSKGVAVVELFTSEGCSSCPPAERVLGELSRTSVPEHRAVFTLAFHVDYWNSLGWADRFSDPAFSERQRQYAETLKLDGVYTPQMVVNGAKQFVGSDRDAAERAVAAALAEKSEATLTVNVSGDSRDGYRVHSVVAGAGSTAVVNFAIVEQGLVTEVKSGENRGRRIDEPSVVRWFKQVPLSQAGDIAVPPLPGVRAEHASIIVYAQRSGTGPVLGAAAVSLPATVEPRR